jgi:hypothetical protein
VAAGVQENVDLALAVPAQDDGLLAHARDEEISRVADLGLVADEKPHPGEYLLQFLGVDPVVDEYLAADAAAGCVDHLVVGRHSGELPSILYWRHRRRVRIVAMIARQRYRTTSFRQIW